MILNALTSIVPLLQVRVHLSCFILRRTSSPSLTAINILISSLTDIQFGDGEKTNDQEDVSRSLTPVSDGHHADRGVADGLEYKAEGVVAAAPVMAVPEVEPAKNEVDDVWGSYPSWNQKKGKLNKRTSSGFGD